MSLLSDYIQEMGCKSILETEDGFATYKIVKLECYIEDIYIVPAARRTKKSFEFAEKISTIARAQGCKYLFGTVNLESKMATESLRGQLTYGFRLWKAEPNFILLMKEL